MAFSERVKQSGKDESKYWQKCRDWLNNEKVTPMSSKLTNLNDFETRYEFYSYLKDGIELCRVIGIVTKGYIPDGIVYRTNNISTLEEKNIYLFIDEVEKQLKIKNIFGKLKEQVLRKYSDFHAVLDALSKISKMVENKIGVKSFKKIQNMKELMMWQDSDIRNIYDYIEQKSCTNHYDEIYQKSMVSL